jgi:hypothetical protein
MNQKVCEQLNNQQEASMNLIARAAGKYIAEDQSLPYFPGQMSHPVAVAD